MINKELIINPEWEHAQFVSIAELKQYVALSFKCPPYPSFRDTITADIFIYYGFLNTNLAISIGKS